MFATKLNIVTVVLLVVGALAAAGALSRHRLAAAPPQQAREGDPAKQVEGPKPAEKKETPVAVQVVKPLAGGLERTTKQACAVHPFDQVDLLPVVSGVLKGQTVDVGDRVKKGQVLAEIDAPLLALEERHAAAALKKAKGQVLLRETHVATAKADVQVAKSLVLQRQGEVESARASADFRQLELDRFKALHKDGAITANIVAERKQLLDAARSLVSVAGAALTNARADLAVKQSKLAEAEAAVTMTRAGMEMAQIALDMAGHRVSLTRIATPIDGIVTRRNFSNGQHLRAGDPGGRISLLTVQRTDQVRVIVDVPGRDVPLIETGAAVDVTIDALPGVRLPGCKVSRIGFALSPSTRTMRVEIDVANPKQLLRPGMWGTAAFLLHKGAARALQVPRSALILTPGGKQAVYIVRDGKARRTTVQVGADNGKEVEIVSGVKPDDLVVTSPRGLKGDVAPVEVTEK